MWIASILMLPLGTTSGYTLSKLSKCTPKQCRTIALETGIQNSTLTIAIIMLSFPGGTEAEDQQQQDVLAFALMYTFFLIVTATITTLGFAKYSQEEGGNDATAVAHKAEEEL